jgi:hypothetical protein
VSSGENGRPPATTPENYQFRALTFALLPRGKLIHRSAWKKNSPKLDFRFTEFSEVRILGILGNSDAVSKGIHGAAEKEPGCVIT